MLVISNTKQAVTSKDKSFNSKEKVHEMDGMEQTVYTYQ